MRPSALIAWSLRPTGPLSDIYLTMADQAAIIEWLDNIIDDAYTEGFCDAEESFLED